MAIAHYSNALTKAGKYSSNRLRLFSLEGIELIIKEKTSIERLEAQEAIRAGTRNPKEQIVGWRMCKSIYKFLSHHYITRRSFVFIVDTQFDSVLYRDKAIKYVKQLFKDLDAEDYFGYISLDATKTALKDEIILEKRGANQQMKKKILDEISKREIDYVFNQGDADSSKTVRLERALEKAYEW